MWSVEEVLNHDYPMALDEDFGGACPCSVIKGNRFEIWTHCWRSSCQDCEFSGIHVSGALPIAVKIELAEHVKNNNGWTSYDNYTIVIEP